MPSACSGRNSLARSCTPSHWWMTLPCDQPNPILMFHDAIEMNKKAIITFLQQSIRCCWTLRCCQEQGPGGKAEAVSGIGVLQPLLLSQECPQPKWRITLLLRKVHPPSIISDVFSTLLLHVLPSDFLYRSLPGFSTSFPETPAYQG